MSDRDVTIHRAVYTCTTDYSYYKGYHITAHSGLPQNELSILEKRAEPHHWIYSSGFKSCISVYPLGKEKVVVQLAVKTPVPDKSGRERIATNMLILSRDDFKKIGCNPFLLDNLLYNFNYDISGRLDALRLKLPNLIDPEPLEELHRQVLLASAKPQLIEKLTTALILKRRVVAIASDIQQGERFLRSLYHFMPSALKENLGFTTFGSPAEDYQLIITTPEIAMHIQPAARDVTFIDFTKGFYSDTDEISNPVASFITSLIFEKTENIFTKLITLSEGAEDYCSDIVLRYYTKLITEYKNSPSSHNLLNILLRKIKLLVRTGDVNSAAENLIESAKYFSERSDYTSLVEFVRSLLTIPSLKERALETLRKIFLEEVPTREKYAECCAAVKSSVDIFLNEKSYETYTNLSVKGYKIAHHYNDADTARSFADMIYEKVFLKDTTWRNDKKFVEILHRMYDLLPIKDGYVYLKMFYLSVSLSDIERSTRELQLFIDTATNIGEIETILCEFIKSLGKDEVRLQTGYPAVASGIAKLNYNSIQLAESITGMCESAEPFKLETLLPYYQLCLRALCKILAKQPSKKLKEKIYRDIATKLERLHEYATENAPLSEPTIRELHRKINALFIELDTEIPKALLKTQMKWYKKVEVRTLRLEAKQVGAAAKNFMIRLVKRPKNVLSPVELAQDSYMRRKHNDERKLFSRII